MSEPTKCYAVSSGEYGDYTIHAIYRRCEDAKAAIARGLEQELFPYVVDGVPVRVWSTRAVENPNKLYASSRPHVEEFDYYEGEPLPAALEER